MATTGRGRAPRGRGIAAGGFSRRIIDGAMGGGVWIVLLLFLGLCLVGGGWNLGSAPLLVVLRPAAILLIVSFLAMRAPFDHALRLPMLLLAGLTVSILIQLIPLPPSLWWRLPGRSALSGLSAALPADAVWRPISLTPSLTWNSLLATLTSWAVLLGFARLPRRYDRRFAGVIVLMALASCLVGMLQLIGGRDSFFYFYNSDGSISGLLANRNHQAVLLAMSLPMLRLWALGAEAEMRLRRGMIAILLGGVILGMLLLTGSRSGLIAALIGIVAAALIAPDRTRRKGRARVAQMAMRWGLIVLPLLLVAVTIVAGRDVSIQRLFSADYTDEIRLRSLPTTLSLVGTYFPIGSGYGSFDTVFRIPEPDALLRPTVFNRAHNDYLELAITGGLLPLTLLVVATIWAIWRGCGSFRSPTRAGDGLLEARGGAAMLLILAIASLSDYPIRPPLMTAVATIAICWIARAEPRAKDRADVAAADS